MIMMRGKDGKGDELLGNALTLPLLSNSPAAYPLGPQDTPTRVSGLCAGEGMDRAIWQW